MEEYTGVIGIVYTKGLFNKYALVKNKITGSITFPSGDKDKDDKSSMITLAKELEKKTGLRPGDYIITKTPIVHKFVYNEIRKKREGQSARQPVYWVQKISDLELSPTEEEIEIDGWYTAEEVIKRVTFNKIKEIFRTAMKFI